MDARNFYVALYDAERGAINFPYYVDLRRRRRTRSPCLGAVRDRQRRRPDRVRPAHQRAGACSPGLTGKPSSPPARSPTSAWPARTGWGCRCAGRARASASSSSRRTSRTPTARPGRRTALTFVGSHIATALTRARAIEETRQRNAELTLVNEIGQALGSQLEFEAIIELVGERIRALVRAGVDVHRPVRRGDRDDQLPVRDRGRQADVDRDLRARSGPDLHRHPRPAAASPGSRRAGTCARGDHLRQRDRVVARRPDPGRRHRHRRDRARGHGARRVRRRRPSGSSARSPRAWPSRSRTRRCSTRRAGCSPRPTSAPPSWPSSTASSRVLPPSSTCSRCTSWWATSSRRSSTRRSSTSASTTWRRGVTHFPYAIERGVRYPDEPTPFADDDARVHRRSRATGHPRCPGMGTRPGQGDPRRPGRAVAVDRARADDRRRRGARRHLAPEPRPDERVQRRRRPTAHDPGGEPHRRPRERAADGRDPSAARRGR